jgi:hypothetical protein
MSRLFLSSREILRTKTGPDCTISLADIRAVSQACGGRRICVWDNLHANDYDQGRRTISASAS